MLAVAAAVDTGEPVHASREGSPESDCARWAGDYCLETFDVPTDQFTVVPLTSATLTLPRGSACLAIPSGLSVTWTAIGTPTGRPDVIEIGALGVYVAP